jgi:A/G-specific adenine glycosylase
MRVPTRSPNGDPTSWPPGFLSSRHRRPFQASLLGWYRENARPLRIRSTRQPWPVLVAEVMAQQTQIARVDDAWAGFLERFPTPRALAEASPADVLRAWSGLGYNRRAVNLQRAAAVIVAEHGGRVPGRVEQLEGLPGVGPYTARAVAALAFAQPVAAVDTNVRRVMSRLAGRVLTARQLQVAADQLVPRDDPATWTHASMELGATLCTSRAPACDACPVSRWCASAGRAGGVEGRVAVAADGGMLPSRPAPGNGMPPRRPAPDGGMPPGRPAPRGPAFEHTTRWLRGRIVEQLRALDDGAWARLPDTIGTHGPEQIAAATAALQQDGILEMRADGSVRLPSFVP